MPDSTYVLTAFRNELETAGLIRRPNVAGPLPPAHVEPGGGAPAPGEREGAEDDPTLAVTIRLSGELAEDNATAYRRRVAIDVLYRSRTTMGLMRGRALDAAIRARLVEGSSYGRGIMLDRTGPAPLFALEVSVFGGLGPVADVGGVRTERAAYVVECLAS